MTEYSGFRWALYFLAEYTNMVLWRRLLRRYFWAVAAAFAGSRAFDFWITCRP